jgi:ribosomal protein L7Ae-like RNA K-turn-binding protein
MSERAYEAVEIAKKNRKTKKRQMNYKSNRKGQAKLVVIAGDVSPKEITMHLPLMCKDKGIPCVTVPSKKS